jgi:hypothetical protein
LACDGGDGPEEAPPTPPAFAAPAAAPAAAAPAAPAPAADNSSGRLAGYDGRFADGAALSPADAARIDSSELRIVRNEVFAQYGRAFRSEDLQAHFGATGWYSVNEAYTDELLTRTDQQNVALLKTFEGDAAKAKALKRGQYMHGDSAALQIFSESGAELVDMTGDIYNWEHQARSWTALGDWVVTWEGASTWKPSDPSISSAQLWKLNHDDGTVIEVFSL